MEDRGRVGDSPIIGAGLYVDQEIEPRDPPGAARSNIRSRSAYHRRKYAPRYGSQRSLPDALKRVARNYNNDRAKLLQFDISLQAVRASP